MLSRRPMVWLAVAFGAGLLAGIMFGAGHWQIWLFAAAAVGWGLARAMRSSRTSAHSPDIIPPLSAPPLTPWLDQAGRDFFLLCLGGLVFLCGWARQDEYSAERTRLAALIPAFCQAEVMVSVSPELTLDNMDRRRWVCAGFLRVVNGEPVPLIPVRLTAEGPAAFGHGDIIKGWATREVTRPPSYPSAFDLGRYLESQGYISALRFIRPNNRASGHAYEVIPAPTISWWRRVQEMRNAAVRAILTSFPAPEGTFLAAITFGYRPPYRDEDFADLQDNFRRAGIAHVMAISGMNVALVAGMVWWVLGLIVGDRRLLAAAAIAACFLYMLLSGLEASSVRATIMAIIHLGGYIIGRKGDLLNSLALAAVLIAGHNPGAILDIGFQLSFTAVLFLALLGEDLAPRAEPGESAPRPAGILRGIGRRIWRETHALFALSLAATVGCTPIIAFHFLQVSLIGLVANVVVVPLSTLVLAAGLLSPAIGWPSLPLKTLLAALLSTPTVFLIRLAEFCGRLPLAAVAVAPIPTWALALYYGGFALFFLRKAMALARRRTLITMPALTAIALSIAAMFYYGWPQSPADRAQVWLVPAARGEAMLIQTERGDLLWLARAPRAMEAERVAAGLGLRGDIRLIDLERSKYTVYAGGEIHAIFTEGNRLAGAAARCADLAVAVWLGPAGVEAWREFRDKATAMEAQVFVSHEPRLRLDNLREIPAKIRLVAGPLGNHAEVTGCRQQWGTISITKADGEYRAEGYDGKGWRLLASSCAATRNPLAKRSGSGP